MGSRGSRTYDQNGSRPIERLTAPNPSAAPAQPAPTHSAATSTGPSATPSPAMQPSFLQRHPLLAGIAGGMAGSWIGHMLFGATDSSARVSEDARAHDGEESAPSGVGSPGLLILLMLLGAGAVYYFMRTRRSPEPDFSGLT